ncbi:MAG: 50S ribosomal protein L24 [bacterium]|nr:MAG: 50S ribosomal protein L24 [bacterium]
MKIKKNDTVRVIAGNYRGMEGKVLKVFPDTGRIIVEKVNLIKRHTRQAGQGQEGGIIEKEAPVDISNVLLVCPKCNRPTRTGMTALADGRKVRQCKKCRETLSDED